MNNKSAMGIREAPGSIINNKQRVLTPSAHRPLGPLESEDPHPEQDLGVNKQTTEINTARTAFPYNAPKKTKVNYNGTNEVKVKGDFALSKLKNLHALN